jgi:undecaprenyl diphosphate synthase
LSKQDAHTTAELGAVLKMPRHVAIIMDGNGRWAQRQRKHRTFGHKAGVEAVRASVTFARKNDIQSLTLFAFSSENWQRPQQEVSVLMELFSFVLKHEVKRLHKNNIRLRVIGDISEFDPKLQTKIAEAQTLTQNNNALILNIAANYGGRWDIVNAAKSMIACVQSGELVAEDISEQDFAQHLSTHDLPELDLLIRTGGDHRVSNFLLWQCAYAEFYFTETLWPDFSETHFQQAVDDFAQRQRRFGMSGEQIMMGQVEHKAC